MSVQAIHQEKDPQLFPGKEDSSGSFMLLVNVCTLLGSQGWHACAHCGERDHNSAGYMLIYTYVLSTTTNEHLVGTNYASQAKFFFLKTFSFSSLAGGCL